MDMKPENLLKQMKAAEEFLTKAKKMSVDVGLPASQRWVMDGDTSVIQIGAIHEYGDGITQRSFLRVPFQVKREDLKKFIEAKLRQGMDGKISTEKALAQIGAYATGISKQAFQTDGYGTWADIKEETKKRKGSSRILVDTGKLQQSITWELKK